MTETRLRGDIGKQPQDISMLWKTYVFESSREKRKGLRTSLEEVSPELAHIAEGLDHHDDAENLFFGFLADFEKKRSKKPILSVSREEVMGWWNGYEHKEGYIEEASVAESKFQEAATLLGRNRRLEKFPVSSTELEIAEADILYRKGVYDEDDTGGQEARRIANGRLRGGYSGNLSKKRVCPILCKSITEPCEGIGAMDKISF